MNIKYLTDIKGCKTAVVIPIKEWESYNKNLNELQQQLKLKYNLKSGFLDIQKAVSGKKKLTTFKEFLNEI